MKSFFILLALTASTSSYAATEIEEDCRSLSTMFGFRSPYTSADQKKLWKEHYEGKVFVWSVKIVDVKEEKAGFVVSAACRGERIGFLSNIELRYPQSAEKFIQLVGRGTSAKIKGKLRDVRYGTGSFKAEGLTE